MSRLFQRGAKLNIPRRRFYRTKKLIKYSLFTGGVIGGVIGGIYAYDPGFKRQCDFYIKAFPCLAHYKYVEYTHEYLYKPTWIPFFKTEKTLDEKYQELHEKYAQFVLDVILELKGLYIKAGQFATGRPDVTPQCWIDKLRTLQDGVPAQDMNYVRDVIESELGQPLEDIFSEFHPESLGAASIGQAHYAKLKPNPENGIKKEMEVCVKIQYPEMEEVFGADLKSIRRFVSFLEPAIAEALEEMETQFLKEFDYIREADNLRVAFKNMNHVFKNEVVVPQPIDHLTTRNVLTMTYIPGEKLEIAIKKRLKDIYQMIKKNNDPKYNPLDDDKEVTLTDLRKEMFNNNKKDNFAPKISLKYYRWFFAVRRFIFNSLATVFNYGVAWIFYPLCGEYDKLPYIPYDVPIVNDPLHFVETILKVHGYQLFINGAFNGDPHPGNILVLDDGRLGLIDYGQVKHLALKERIELAKLMIFLKRDDGPGIVKQVENMGLKTRDMNPYIFEKIGRFYFDCDSMEVTDGMNMLLFMEWIENTDPALVKADDYVFPARLRMLISGLHWNLGYEFKASESWNRWAQKLLDDNGVVV